MSAELPLDGLQRWLQSVVVHPGSVEEALRSKQAQRELEASRLNEIVLPSPTLSPSQRLEIYHGMYPLRMTDALASDYPALQHFLGDDSFRDLVCDYVQTFPSRSHTLNRLGDHLPEFVREAQGLPRREFCYDLARLELALTEVFDAPETPCLTEGEIAAVPPEAWERARFTPVDAFRLLELRYPANAYLQTVKDHNHDHPRTRRKDTWVAVYRRDHSVYRLELSRPAHGLLADLISGAPLGQAMARAMRAGRRAPAEEQVFGWFREWALGGIFRSVETSESPQLI